MSTHGNAHAILAAAMGKPMPPAVQRASTAVPDVETAPTMHYNANDQIVWAQVAAVFCAASAFVIIFWLVVILWRARQRMIPKHPPVPLDYTRQRSLERLAARQD